MMDAIKHEEAVDMCLTCGCMRPHDDMGNPDNLVIEDLEKSAAASGVSLDKSVANLVKTLDVAKAETETSTGRAT
jgi:hypothetical protein